jgi:hypothetical protein
MSPNDKNPDIPEFLKIPQVQRDSAWKKNPPQQPASPVVPAKHRLPTTEEQVFQEATRNVKKFRTEKRIAMLKIKQEWKSIPEQFRRWDPRQGKFVDERIDDQKRLLNAAERLGITLETDDMTKLTIVPYVEGQDLPVTRAKTTVAADVPGWELQTKIRQAGIRAGKKLQRVEVVDAEGLVTAVWQLDKENDLLTNGTVTIPMKPVQTEQEVKQEKSMARKAKSVAKKNGVAKAKAEARAAKGPGVIATIIETIKRDRGATAEEIVAILVKRFPDRKAKSMHSTVKIQANKNAKKKDRDDKRGLIYYG